MTVRLIFLFLLVFLISFTASAQPGFTDSVGTIYVKKKGRDTILVKHIIANDEVFLIAGDMPRFPSIGVTVNEFIKKNFVVPQEAFDKGISGAVIVQFLVEKDGTLKNIKVQKGVPNCSSCDVEALRVVKLMPSWVPGYQGGKPVPVLMSIPVRFRFNGE